MISVTHEQLLRLAPHALLVYQKAFDTADELLAIHGINANGRRLAHFMAQILHESGGLTILEESLTYRSAERICAVWPKRFPTIAVAAPFVRNPIALANHVYGRRMGNTQKGDGYAYRGRGPLQLTGRANYAHYSELLGVDLVKNPDLVASPACALAVPAAFWSQHRLNDPADNDDLKGITRVVNGGLNGLENRAGWLAKAKAIWPEPIATSPKCIGEIA